MDKRLRHDRITLDEANGFVDRFHRHHGPVVGHLFSIGAFRDLEMVGVIIVGRPVSRMRDDGRTAEVTRLCTDGTKNVCSFLYGKAARAAFALGFTKIGTYTLPSEGGASLRACGWRLMGLRGGGEWTCPSRPRKPMKSPISQKWLWEKWNEAPDGRP
ncbi:MAG: XF1762 family protein [Pseudomonadota bacterium]